jgi:hypothetical protein
MTETRDQRTEVRGQRAEIRAKKQSLKPRKNMKRKISVSRGNNGKNQT